MRQKKREVVLSLKFKLALWVSKDTELFPSSISFFVSLSHPAPSFPCLFSFSLSLSSLALIKSLLSLPRTASSN